MLREESKSGRGTIYTSISICAIREHGSFLHDSEAGPLHANLEDSKKASEARKSIYFTAASHVLTTVWQSEDVCELACS